MEAKHRSATPEAPAYPVAHHCSHTAPVQQAVEWTTHHPQRAYLLQYIYSHLTPGNKGNNEYVTMNAAVTNTITQSIGWVRKYLWCAFLENNPLPQHLLLESWLDSLGPHLFRCPAVLWLGLLFVSKPCFFPCLVKLLFPKSRNTSLPHTLHILETQVFINFPTSRNCDPL